MVSAGSTGVPGHPRMGPGLLAPRFHRDHVRHPAAALLASGGLSIRVGGLGRHAVPRHEAGRLPELTIATVRVMTFNILHDSMRSLNPPWSVRRPLVMETIRSTQADVVCLQEVSPRQLEHLSHDLTEYELIPGEPTGLTRFPSGNGLLALVRPIFGDYIDRGEYCPILIRRGGLTCANEGSYRIKSSRAGLAQSWAGSGTPHVITWVNLEGSGRRFTLYNTHLGIVPWNWARTGTELLALLDRDWSGEPQILVGDFN